MRRTADNRTSITKKERFPDSIRRFTFVVHLSRSMPNIIPPNTWKLKHSSHLTFTKIFLENWRKAKKLWKFILWKLREGEENCDCTTKVLVINNLCFKLTPNMIEETMLNASEILRPTLKHWNNEWSILFLTATADFGVKDEHNVMIVNTNLP
jgi:hypothetical protein